MTDGRHMRLMCALILFGSILAGGAGVLPAAAQSRPQLLEGLQQVSTMEQAQEWITYYYLHPRPDLLPSALEVFSKAGLLTSKEDASGIVSFIAQLCVANPDKVNSWALIVAKRSEDQKVAVEAALWIANSVESRLALTVLGASSGQTQKKAIDQMLSSSPPDVLRGDIESPTVIDGLWGGFFATGDARYVRRVISVLPLINTKINAEGAAAKVSLGRAAERSLTNNAILHPAVMATCESELGRAPSDEKAVLAHVVQRAKEGKR